VRCRKGPTLEQSPAPPAAARPLPARPAAARSPPTPCAAARPTATAGPAVPSAFTLRLAGAASGQKPQGPLDRGGHCGRRAPAGNRRGPAPGEPRGRVHPAGRGPRGRLHQAGYRRRHGQGLQRLHGPEPQGAAESRGIRVRRQEPPAGPVPAPRPTTTSKSARRTTTTLRISPGSSNARARTSKWCTASPARTN
jgi:translation initiation factor IF-2